MPFRPTLKLMFAAAAVTVAWPVHAQEGNVGRGAEIARSICAACHVVTRGQSAAPNSQAPPFFAIASKPGMTSIALSAALMTSHRYAKHHSGAGRTARRDCLYSQLEVMVPMKTIHTPLAALILSVLVANSAVAADAGIGLWTGPVALAKNI